MSARKQEGLVIAATSKITRQGNRWLVPSQSGKCRHTVSVIEDKTQCTCEDSEINGAKCKHQWAVEFVMQRELFDTGKPQKTPSIRTLSKRVRKPTYPQNWRAYTSAQLSEKETFQILLGELCKGIPEPPQHMGRPRVPLADAIFSACFKVYSTVSGRRFMTDLKEAHDKGRVGRLLSWGSLFKVFESPDVFPILRSLVEQSAAPLKSVEENFACDSTGFSGCRFDRWFDHKYGSPMRKVLRAWVKCHAMVGVKTHVVTAVEIFDQHANDGVQLPKLLATTTQRFNVKEVSADLAYSSRTNLEAIDATGASPMIPFKRNATAKSGGLWAKCYHFFSLHRDEFLARYHRRSNVEAAFSAIKRKLGDSLRSKTDVAMKNEALAKLVCHNILCVIAEMHEQGIDPTFWTQSAPVQNVVAS
jgi:transposase